MMNSNSGVNGQAVVGEKPRFDVTSGLKELAALAAAAADQLQVELQTAADVVCDALGAGGKILVCGNGGSAADAQHFVAELVGHMVRDRRSLPALSLSSDPSIVTAIGNDYGYEQLFSRQIEGLGQSGDVLIIISTSGRSANILLAAATARRKGMKTIALTGKSPADDLLNCDVCLRVDSASTQRVQEIHTAVLHAICEYVDDTLA